MMITRAGLIVWFEPESGDKNKFGIRFPMAPTQPEALPITVLIKERMKKDGIEKFIIKIV